MNLFDDVIIGGGFYGMYIARHLARKGRKVIVVERESEFMQRASLNNQARVHHGYHYPKDVLTALRCRLSFPRFIAEFSDCIDKRFEKYYAIGRILGSITARHFEMFCESIGAPCEPAPAGIRQLFNAALVEAVYKTEEVAFNADLLRDVLGAHLDGAGVECQLNTEVLALERRSDAISCRVVSDGAKSEIIGHNVYDCTYSAINRLNAASGQAPVRLKHELTEICLVSVPEDLRNLGVTIMCGPFFSLMPFPVAEELHSFSHVRYTPHFTWHDDPGTTVVDPKEILNREAGRSSWKFMLRDASRYMPMFRGAEYRRSLWEIKTTLPRNERNDGRPILFLKDYCMSGHHCVLGGKIDNIYDIVEQIDLTAG